MNLDTFVGYSNYFCIVVIFFLLKFSTICSNHASKKLGNETSRRRSPKLFNYTAKLGESQVAVNEEWIYSSHSFLLFEDLCFLSSFCEMIIECFDYY